MTEPVDFKKTVRAIVLERNWRTGDTLPTESMMVKGKKVKRSPKVPVSINREPVVNYRAGMSHEMPLYHAEALCHAGWIQRDEYQQLVGAKPKAPQPSESDDLKRRAIEMGLEPAMADELDAEELQTFIDDTEAGED